MKFLKWLFIILIVIIGIIAIYGATQPAQMKVEESIIINAPATMVFEEIENFELWGQWSAWDKMDTAMQQQYEGEPGTVGHKNSWVSENMAVGTGSQEIIELRDNEYMKVKMLFNGSTDENFASFTLAENDGKTTVVWDMLGAETPFYARIMNAIFKPMIVESYKSSLADLKLVVESKPIAIPNPFNLEVVEVEAQSFVSIKDSCTVEEMPSKMKEIYTELGIFMGMKGIESGANTLAYYYTYSPKKVVFEPAFTVNEPIASNGRIRYSTTPAGKALKAVYVGDNEGLYDVHMGIEAYAKASGINLADFCWEVYINQEGDVQTNELETHIYYSIK